MILRIIKMPRTLCSERNIYHAEGSDFLIDSNFIWISYHPILLSIYPIIYGIFVKYFRVNVRHNIYQNVYKHYHNPSCQKEWIIFKWLICATRACYSTCQSDRQFHSRRWDIAIKSGDWLQNDRSSQKKFTYTQKCTYTHVCHVTAECIVRM